MALTNLSPAPTFADPVLYDAKRKPGDPGFSKFNPIWLRWFLDAATYIQAAAGGSITHNSLLGLQGGTTGEFYHLTAAEFSAIGAVQAAHSVYAGPTSGSAASPSFRALVAADFPGISATIATAKLTSGGANGSMTFVNGILTAQTPAT